MLFEIGQQSVRGTVNIGTLSTYATGQTAMMIPTRVVQLYEPYIALSQPPG
jgi:hypothetical protein